MGAEARIAGEKLLAPRPVAEEIEGGGEEDRIGATWSKLLVFFGGGGVTVNGNATHAIDL